VNFECESDKKHTDITEKTSA